LIPYIEPKQKKKHIDIGSSLGGLVSLCNFKKYPEVLVSRSFSPSFWFSNKIYDLAQIHKNKVDLFFFAVTKVKIWLPNLK
jgi:predicted alpha/beta superfamily hydrolase